MVSKNPPIFAAAARAHPAHGEERGAPGAASEGRMRVLVWGINYAPEVTGIAPYNVALCEHLRAQGHEVEMITTFPYYPAWRKRPEDARQLYRTDVIEGVPVHRCWHYVPARVSAVRRIVHEATFVFTSLLRVLTRPRAEVMVIVSAPLLLGLAGILVEKLRGTPWIFHVQDLQPDAALGLGMLRGHFLARLLYRMEALIYRRATRVSGISRGMIEVFTAKGVPAVKRIYFPNCVIPIEPASLPAPGAFRARREFGRDDFLAVYSGNFGVKQGLRVLLDAAALLEDPRIRIVICGDGAERESLQRIVASRGLANVRLLSLKAPQQYREMIVDADVCLITQQAGAGKAFFPSKLLATLNFGKPVLTVADADSELARVLAEGAFGVNVEPEQPLALARQLEALARSPDKLRAMAGNGRRYVEQFEASQVFAAFEETLAEVVQVARRGAS